MTDKQEKFTIHTPDTALVFVERLAKELRALGVFVNVNAIDAARFIRDGLAEEKKRNENHNRD